MLNSHINHLLKLLHTILAKHACLLSITVYLQFSKIFFIVAQKSIVVHQNCKFHKKNIYICILPVNIWRWLLWFYAVDKYVLLYIQFILVAIKNMLFEACHNYFLFKKYLASYPYNHLTAPNQHVVSANSKHKYETY